jgi:hypothetical protein
MKAEIFYFKELNYVESHRITTCNILFETGGEQICFILTSRLVPIHQLKDVPKEGVAKKRSPAKKRSILSVS